MTLTIQAVAMYLKSLNHFHYSSIFRQNYTLAAMNEYAICNINKVIYRTKIINYVLNKSLDYRTGKISIQ